MYEQVRRKRWLAGAGFALLVNAVLLVAYIWSRGGQVTALRVEVRGDEFAVFVDGRERLREQLRSPDSGGVRVHAPDRQFDPPTNPTGARIESIRVTSATGDVLYEATGSMISSDTVDLSARAWTDYTVDVRYRNVMAADVDVRVQGDDAVTASIQYFGGGFVRLSSSQSAVTTPPALAYIEPDPWQAAKGATATALKAYPLTVALVLTAMLLLWVRSRVPWLDSPLGSAKWLRHVPTAVAALFVVTVVGVTGFLLRGLLDGAINGPDEVSYIFQSRILASGRSHLHTPPIPEAFQFYSDAHGRPWMVDYGGRWASFYPVGHPLALIPGVLLGAPWIMPPLIGGVNVALLYAIGKRMYGAWTAALAAAFFACSPFLLMQASTFMAHNTTTAFMLAALLSAISLSKRPYIAGALAGVFFGLMFLARPLPSVVFAAPLGGLLLVRAMPFSRRVEGWRHVIAFAAAGVCMFAVYLAYNWSTTGDPLQSGYTAGDGLGDAFGFGGEHSVANGIGNQAWNMMALVLVLNGWPAWLGLALGLVPFAMGSRRGFDWFFLASAVLMIASATLVYTTSIYNGPRYIFEALPFLMLLTARGVVCLFEPPTAEQSGLELVRATTIVTPVRAMAAIGVVLLVAMSTSGWLFSRSTEQEFLAIPPSASSMDDLRALDTRLIDQASDSGIHDALVFVRICDPIRNCYLSTFLENNLELDGDIVWVADRGTDANRELYALYPCRAIYHADYDRRTLAPAGMTPPPAGTVCAGG